MTQETQNAIIEINNKLRKLALKVNSANEILISDGPLSGQSTCCYVFGINNTNGDLYYVDVNGEWQLESFSGGGGSSQNLQQTLDNGNLADLPIQLTDDAAKFYVSDTAGNNITTLEPDRITMQNSSGFTTTILADLIDGNYSQHLPPKSGTFAMLSDIPVGGPMTITRKTLDYTLQLADGDNNTLVTMNVGVANTLTLDSAINFPIGTSIMVGSEGAGQTTIVPIGTTIILTPNSVDPILTFQNSGGVLIKISSTKWYFWGDVGNTSAGAIQDLQSVLDQGNTANDKAILLSGDSTGFFSQSTDNLDQLYMGCDGANAAIHGSDRSGTIFNLNNGGTYGLFELTVTALDKNVLTLFGKSTSDELFSVLDVDTFNPYFKLTPSGGTMYGDWVITRSGSLNIATAVNASVDMLTLTNVNDGSHSIKFDVDDVGVFKIKHNSTTYLTFNTNGDITTGDNVAGGGHSFAIGNDGQALGISSFGSGESYVIDADSEASSALCGWGCSIVNSTDSAIGGTGAAMGNSGGSFVFGNNANCYDSPTSIVLGQGTVDGAPGGNIGGNIALGTANISGKNCIGIGATSVSGNSVIGIGPVTATLKDVVHVSSLYIDPATIGVYADNAAAITGGLIAGQVYRTGDLLKIVH